MTTKPEAHPGDDDFGAMRTSAGEARARFHDLPKIELHIHLEGAIPLGTLRELILKYGGDPRAGDASAADPRTNDARVADPEALAARLRFRNLAEFLQVWEWKNGFLREYEDFTRIAAGAAASLRAQNVLYAEMFFSPQSFASRGLRADKLSVAVREGLARVPEVKVALILDLVRDLGPQAGMQALDAVCEAAGEAGVVGIGIGGSEHLVAPELFAPVFSRARKAGLHTTAHAGEACGPESIWGAVRTLAVERIGHATRAIEDPALVAHLAERKTPLELCPWSNVRTGAIARIEDHPARIFFERGIPISVNTDDPGFFCNTLADEYLALHQALGFSCDEIAALNGLAVDQCWLPESEKAILRERMRKNREPAKRAPGNESG